MPRRKDAFVAASKVVAGLDELARNNAPYAVATVGMLDVFPSSRNIIPGQVSFSVDLRHPEAATLEMMGETLRTLVSDACGRDGLDAEVNEIWYFPPVQFDETCINAVRNAAEAAGYGHRDMVSGAGHDSCYTARVTPTSMIFIPCKDGLSHNELEYSKPEDIEAGCNVLLRAALDLAQA